MFAFKMINNARPLAHSSYTAGLWVGAERAETDWEHHGLWLSVHSNGPSSLPLFQSLHNSPVPLSHRMKFQLSANQLMMPASWSSCGMPSPVPWQKREKAVLLLGNFLCAREMRPACGEVSVFSGEAVSMGTHGITVRLRGSL